MEVVYPRCSGLDVHKRFVVACHAAHREGTATERSAAGEIHDQRASSHERVVKGRWMYSHRHGIDGCVTSNRFFTCLKESSRLCWSMRNTCASVPGRKTDIKDADWIADLLQHGLLKASFIPSSEQQAVRDLTRTRMRLRKARTRLVNRIHKVLEDANRHR